MVLVNFLIMKRICILGPGIVGTATGKALKKIGHKIGFIGRNKEKAYKLQKEGFWSYTFDSLPNHSYDFDISMITIATPTDKGKIDLNPLKQVVNLLSLILRLTKGYHLVVVKSTVPPGTTQKMVIEPILEKTGKKLGREIGFCMNPEYLRAETALEDSLKPWLILIGESDKKAGLFLREVYESFLCPIYHCSIIEAEFQKYIHNLFNATKITFFNEMREIGKKMGIDTSKSFKVTSLSCEGMFNPEYGTRDLGPFSGFCLPKDTQAFYSWAKTKKFDVSLLERVIEVNNRLIRSRAKYKPYIQEFDQKKL